MFPVWKSLGQGKQISPNISTKLRMHRSSAMPSCSTQMTAHLGNAQKLLKSPTCFVPRRLAQSHKSIQSLLQKAHKHTQILKGQRKQKESTSQSTQEVKSQQKLSTEKEGYAFAVQTNTLLKHKRQQLHFSVRCRKNYNKMEVWHNNSALKDIGENW